MLPDILLVANHCLNNDQHLRNLIKTSNINVITNAKVPKISESQVFYEQNGKESIINHDTVLNAAGFKSNNDLVKELEDKFNNVTAVGDAIKPRKILDAIHEDYHAIRVINDEVYY